MSLPSIVSKYCRLMTVGDSSGLSPRPPSGCPGGSRSGPGYCFGELARMTRNCRSAACAGPAGNRRPTAVMRQPTAVNQAVSDVSFRDFICLPLPSEFHTLGPAWPGILRCTLIPVQPHVARASQTERSTRPCVGCVTAGLSHTQEAGGGSYLVTGGGCSPRSHMTSRAPASPTPSRAPVFRRAALLAAAPRRCPVGNRIASLKCLSTKMARTPTSGADQPQLSAAKALIGGDHCA